MNTGDALSDIERNADFILNLIVKPGSEGIRKLYVENIKRDVERLRKQVVFNSRARKGKGKVDASE